MLFSRAAPLCAFLLLGSSSKALGGTVPLDSREANAHPAHVLAPRAVPINTFAYNATNGPLTWWFKIPNSGLCRTGRNQSPILLDSSISQAPPGAVVFNGVTNPGKLENLGTAVEVVEVEGTTTYENRTYSLVNFHFHTPSEHRINKEHFAVEMHFVHRDPTGKILVLGFPFQLIKNRGNNLARIALEKVNQIAPGESVTTDRLRFNEISDYVRTKSLYKYGGSLTTPPCSEGLQWLVATEPLELGLETYNALKSVLGYNARNIQNVPGGVNAIDFACAGVH